jgi:cytochrome b561
VPAKQESTMSFVNTETRYGALPQTLHWLTVICVMVGWLLGQFMDDFPKGVARASALSAHIVLGEFVIILLAGRLLWRLADRPPAPLPSRFGRAAEIAAKLGHLVLYTLLLAVPFVGIVALLKRGDALPIFGVWHVVSPWPADRAAAHGVLEVHELLANTLLILAALHASAALIHHYVFGDRTLVRMLPGRG